MELLPASHEEFSQPDYWDKFFKKRKTSFEWYGEYPELCSVIHKYVNPSCRTLVVGCGNSALSEAMYDAGLTQLTNIDISSVVVRQMADKHRTARPHMTFEQVDVTKMQYEDERFHCALDKGTLDALCVSEDADVTANVHAMFSEVSRVLRVGGRYMIISLLQDHVQRCLVSYFTALRWPIRVHKIVTETEGESMPVFAVVVTKLRPMPAGLSLPQITEVVRFGDRVDRLEDVSYLSQVVRDMQYFHSVRQRLGKRMDQQVSLELHSAGSAQSPRYGITVVDSLQRSGAPKFAVFIVPQGRETDWMFCTDKGRCHLAQSAGFGRLAVVILGRGHDFSGGLDAIKAELSLKVMELAPSGLSPKAQVPFLSIGEDVGQRREVARGHSEFSGNYLVEDVEINGGQWYRRLIFLDWFSQVVQSEARLVAPSSGRKKKKRRQKNAMSEETKGEGPPPGLKVDHGYLASDYLIGLVGGLALLPDLHQEAPLSCLLVGLGGGGLAAFLHRALPQMFIRAVELDPAVAEIARSHFDLDPTLTPGLEVSVADGLEVVRDLANKGPKQDVIIIDADSKDTTVGLSCPSAPFMEPDFLSAIKLALKPEGLLLLNLAARDEDVRHSATQRLAGAFPHMATLALEEDINTLVYAAKEENKSPLWGNRDLFMERMGDLQTKIKAAWPDTNVELPEVMAAATLPDL